MLDSHHGLRVTTDVCVRLRGVNELRRKREAIREAKDAEIKAKQLRLFLKKIKERYHTIFNRKVYKCSERVSLDATPLARPAE